MYQRPIEKEIQRSETEKKREWNEEEREREGNGENADLPITMTRASRTTSKNPFPSHASIHHPVELPCVASNSCCIKGCCLWHRVTNDPSMMYTCSSKISLGFLAAPRAGSSADLDQPLFQSEITERSFLENADLWLCILQRS